MRRISFLMAALILLATVAVGNPGKNKNEDKAPLPDAAKYQRHYWLLKNGGVIEFACTAPCAPETDAALQKYVTAVSKQFEKGDFEAENEGLSKPPDNLPQLKKLRDEITFSAGTSDNGWSLRMLTINPAAQQAIHQFLKHQITERKTGDPLEVQ